MAELVEAEGAPILDASSSFFVTSGKVEVEGKEPLRNEENIAIAGPDYFRLFQGQQWLGGSPEASLSAPGQIVLTVEKAKQYFDSEDALQTIGKTLVFRDSLPLTVSGILDNPPERSDFEFGAFISYSTIENSWISKLYELHNWDNTNSQHQLFIKLKPGVEYQNAEQLLSEKGSEAYQKITDYGDAEITTTFALQPLSGLHFNSGLGIFNYSRKPAHLPTLYALLSIAVINFINLETAQSARRAREVGVRKAVGGTRGQLMKQFLFETLMVTLVVVGLSIGLAELGLHYFSSFIPDGVSLNLASPLNIGFLAGLTIIVSLLSGAYPAFILSGFRPVFALKGEKASQASKAGHINLRRGLIIFQFIIAQALIFGNLAIGAQLKYMLKKDLGFEKDAVVYFQTPYDAKPEKRQLLADKIRNYPEITALSQHQQTPSSTSYSTSVVTFQAEDGSLTSNNPHKKFGDTSFIHLYGIELLAGRNLMPSDTVKEMLINQAYAEKLGFENPQAVLGQRLEYSGNKIPIVGVVKDFHQSSLHDLIAPIMIASELGDHRMISLKLKTAGQSGAVVSSLLKKVEKDWATVFPDEPFSYQFFDESLARVYRAERQASVLSAFAMGVAILLSCLGLLGLVSYTTTQRTKEIGIRKVLGASIHQLVALLTKDFVVLVLIASMVALPLGWYFSRQWLNDFAYHITLDWWMFVLVALGALTIALLTVSFKAVRAALANPVESLKVE